MTSSSSEGLLTEKHVARLLGLSVYCLQRWRCYGGGPDYVRIGGPSGRAIRYKKEAIDRWIEKNTISGDALQAIGAQRDK